MPLFKIITSIPFNNVCVEDPFFSLNSLKLNGLPEENNSYTFDPSNSTSQIDQ